MAWLHGPGCLQQAACISLRHDLHFQPRQVLPPTSSTCTDFLCKIEQLNGLNKSDDKTLIAIFLPPFLKRAICRHLERYFIKQKRKQFRKFLVNLPPESCGARLSGFDQLGSRGLTAPPLGVHGDGKPLASSWPVPGRESWWGEGRGESETPIPIQWLSPNNWGYLPHGSGAPTPGSLYKYTLTNFPLMNSFMSTSNAYTVSTGCRSGLSPEQVVSGGMGSR